MIAAGKLHEHLIAQRDAAIEARRGEALQAAVEQRQSWTYLLHAGGRYKIGTTTRVCQRVDEIATACPFPLTLIAAVRDEDLGERDLHDWYADYRAHREWFALPPEEAEKLTAHMRHLQEQYNAEED